MPRDAHGGRAAAPHGIAAAQFTLGLGGLFNLTCLALLWRFRKVNVNMSSTFECSRNDVAANVGVLVAAGLVAATGTAWPDIAVGAIIALIFLHSAWRVLADAIPAWRASRPAKRAALK